MRALSLVCFLALLAALPVDCSPLIKPNGTTPGKPAVEEACFLIYQPVCAGNNKTYGNICEATRNLTGLTTNDNPKRSLLPLIDGSCCGSVECGSMGYRPICATSGKIYRNACEAYLANATISHSVELPCDGNSTVGMGGLQCKGPEVARCIEIYRPVCGVSNRTWANSCWAEANGDCVEHEGPCSA